MNFCSVRLLYIKKKVVDCYTLIQSPGRMIALDSLDDSLVDDDTETYNKGVPCSFISGRDKRECKIYL